jgi:chromosome segregation ATPase
MAVCTGDQTSPPDLYKFEKETANITEKINKLQRQLDHSTTGNKQITDQLHAAGIKLENAEEERRKIVAQQKTIEDSIRKLGQSFLKQRELVNHLVVGLRYKTEGAYNEQILKLESQLEASHFSFNDRKKLQQTVESLKEGKDKLKDYLEAKQVMDDCRNEQDAMRKEKDVSYGRVY